jgi:hypothetical protein
MMLLNELKIKKEREEQKIDEIRGAGEIVEERTKGKFVGKLHRENMITHMRNILSY